MEGKAPHLDFSCISAMIEILKYNPYSQIFSRIKSNHFIILSIYIQCYILITTWKPQQLQGVNSLYVLKPCGNWFITEVVSELCTFCAVIYFPKLGWLPSLQKQKVFFGVRFDMTAIWETMKEVCSVLREYKLVSSATREIFPIHNYFERE